MNERQAAEHDVLAGLTPAVSDWSVNGIINYIKLRKKKAEVCHCGKYFYSCILDAGSDPSKTLALVCFQLLIRLTPFFLGV